MNKLNFVERDGRRFLRFEESFTGVIPEAVRENKARAVAVFEEAKTAGKTVALKPKIEAIHSKVTRNMTFYPAEKLQGDSKLKSGVYSWTHPYAKPMLTHHNSFSGEPVGRIYEAYYVEKSAAGNKVAANVIVPTITDPVAMNKILDGRYLTVSIGAEVDAAYCSVCGADWVAHPWSCPHERGVKYNKKGEEDPINGKEMYFTMGNIYFDECSYVDVPSDTAARNMSVDAPEEIELWASTDESAHSTVMNLSRNGAPSASFSEAFELHGPGVQEESTLPDEETIKTEEQEPVAPAEETNTDPAPVEEGVGEGEDQAPSALEVFKGLVSGMITALAGFSEELDADSQELIKQLVDGLKALLPKEEGKEAAELSALKESLGDAVFKREAADKALAELQTKYDELQSSTSTLTDRSNELESSLVNQQAESKRLLEENAELGAQLHKSLAERVVDLKMALGKPGVEDRESAIQDHLVREASSLQDSLVDLLAEAQAAKVAPVVLPRISSQGAVVPVNNEQTQTSASTVEETAEPAKPAPTTQLSEVYRGLVDRAHFKKNK